ncbi:MULTISPECIES: MmoB/DmpM family protein [Mycobacterium]|uniref:MmoB/DmpM family protein n=1 Tax=Mycobacterium lentiflavum TaxID=141349 RepID=A0A0E4GY39_MYCLN|nr:MULTISPECIES: MmoB/DmpM family protein [Mycobacterium]MEE3065383.1 MmoB/DmpM family protein [Actinomycetota bacterium]ULP44825.1 MmoB/DmpM family protein [Mycobacterium lentiflavum]WAC94114.1 MmoB/DmpM family protein [Mycobacterium sp. Aquia_213]CQD14047.1 Toluene-4-monooxygenase system protein D [Mycobacterium lentiflavum]
MTSSTDEHKLVGPIVRGFDPDIVAALTEAIQLDNPDADIVVEDHSGYVRIHAPWFLKVTSDSLEYVAGESIPLASLEPAIAGFAGRMRYVGDHELHWYLERED